MRSVRFCKTILNRLGKQVSERRWVGKYPLNKNHIYDLSGVMMRYERTELASIDVYRASESADPLTPVETFLGRLTRPVQELKRQLRKWTEVTYPIQGENDPVQTALAMLPGGMLYPFLYLSGLETPETREKLRANGIHLRSHVAFFRYRITHPTALALWSDGCSDPSVRPILLDCLQDLDENGSGDFLRVYRAIHS